MERKWCEETVEKDDETGDIARKEGSGPPKSVRTEESLELVEEIILSQEDQPGTHYTPAEIARELDHRLVSRIIDQDLDLCFLRKRKLQKVTDSNIEKRMIRSRKLLPKYTQKTLQTAFFSGEKIFR